MSWLADINRQRKYYPQKTKWRKNQRALSGPFEELPVLMIVTLTISIFLLTLNNTMVLYRQNDETIKLDHFAETFSKSFLEYKEVLHENSIKGTFDCDAVKNLTAQKIITDFKIDTERNGFNVTISDISNYHTAKDYFKSVSAGSPNQKEIISRSWMISIWVNPNEVHTGRLLIMVWSK